MKRSRTLPERLSTLLDGFLSKRLGSERHLAGCRISQWVDGYSGPDGAPCSPRCLEARQLRALLDGRTELSGLPLFGDWGRSA